MVHPEFYQNEQNEQNLEIPAQIGNPNYEAIYE
jgi:hypothetical protein